MQTSDVLLTLVAGFSLGHILFVAGYLALQKPVTSRILAILLFCLAVRVGKSISLLLFPQLIFAETIIALGVIAMSAIGPLLLAYVNILLSGNIWKPATPHLIHLAPAVLLAGTAFFLNDSQMFHVYQVTVYLVIGYLLVAIRRFWKQITTVAPATANWLKQFLTACVLLAVVFLIQLYTRSAMVYVTVSVFAATVLYFLTLRASTQKQVFAGTAVKQKRVQDPELVTQVRNRVSRQKLYLDPALTLNKLALEMNLPVHVLSGAINNGSQVSFPEFINEFRVKDAEEKLRSKQWSRYTIEAIAYDSGFHSLSAFYSSFRKHHRVSPARYRKLHSS